MHTNPRFLAHCLLAATSCVAPTTIVACDDTKNEERAEANEERMAELQSYERGAGPIDREIAGEVAERRGELARDVGADPSVDRAIDPASCESVYRHAAAMRQGEDSFAGVAKATQAPDRGRFMQVCEKLPQQVRACMSIGYAYAHGTECEDAIDSLQPTLRAELSSLARR